MTTMAAQQTAENASLYAEIHDWLNAEATHRLTAMGGTWRDPKDIGLFRCRVG